MASNVETQILSGYADTAAQLLSAKYSEYNENDVVKLAEFLIDQDISRAELTKRAALYDNAGRELARQLIKEGSFATAGKSLDSILSTVGNKIGKSKEWVLNKFKKQQQPSVSGYGPRSTNSKGGVSNDFVMYGDDAAAAQGSSALVPVKKSIDSAGKGFTENDRKSSLLEQLGDLIKQKEFLIGAGAGGVGGYMVGSD